MGDITGSRKAYIQRNEGEQHIKDKANVSKYYWDEMKALKVVGLSA